MNGRVLIAEDEAKIASVMADYLGAADCEEAWVDDDVATLRRIEAEYCDLALLDLMLPGLDGLEVCLAPRRGAAAGAGIVMVTARVDQFERLPGLAVGADDYLCKPFSPRELVTRVHARVRQLAGRLAPAADGLCIENVYGVGYRFPIARPEDGSR